MKLADEFDRFTTKKGEKIQSYYLRFAKLMNDILINEIKMSPIQINTKFLNHLQPEWKRHHGNINDIAKRSNTTMHSEAQDKLMHKLKVVVKGENKYEMKILDEMLNDNIKKWWSTGGTNRDSSASVVRTKIKGVLKKRSAVKGSGSMSTKIIIETKKKAIIDENVEKETYIDDEEQLRWATLLSVDTKRKRIERESQDDDDLEGEIDEAGQYMVYVHSEEKQTSTFRPLSPPRTRSSQDDVSHYVNENSTPFWRTLTCRGLQERLAHIITIKPTSSHKKNHVRRIISQAKQKKVNPMSQQLQTLTKQLQQQKQRLDDLMTFKVPDAIEESVGAHIINEVKNKLPKYLMRENKEEKYFLSLTKRPATVCNLNGIEEEIIRFRSIVVVYDEDAKLGIHHWPKLRKGFNKTRKASLTREDVHLNSKIVTMKHIEVERKYDYGFLSRIDVIRSDGNTYTFKERVRNYDQKSEVGYRHGYLNGREWTVRDIRRSGRMINEIERILKARAQMRRLESFVGG
nr:hypothetical protein [Tanacetum cinerariifolium]